MVERDLDSVHVYSHLVQGFLHGPQPFELLSVGAQLLSDCFERTYPCSPYNLTVECKDEGCVDLTVCDPGSSGQLPVLVNAFVADVNAAAAVSQVVADNFLSLEVGNVTGVRWWGVYATLGPVATCDPQEGDSPDNFTVTYYNDNNGLPGTVISSFSQGDLTLTNLTDIDTNLDVVGFAIPLR